LAKAQNLEEVNEVMQFYQIANALGPGGVAEVKPDAIATFVGDKLGIPSNLRTSEEEKQVIAQQATKLFQQQIAGGGGPGQGGAPAAPSPPMPPQQEPAEAVEDEVSA
jgi:hypothetical protein